MNPHLPVYKHIHNKFFSSPTTREDLLNIEKWVKNMKTSFDKCPYPLFHDLKNGLYTREIHMKAGHLVVSKIHKDDYFIAMLKGRNWLINQYEARDLVGPIAFKIRGGAKNILFILEDTVWIDTHKVKAETIEEAEKEIFAASFDEYDEYNRIVEASCLVG